MILKLIRESVYNVGFKLEVKISKYFNRINDEINKGKISKYSFGKKNPRKKFYVIKISPGGGFFSNLLYILLNLEIADKKKFVPIVDMQNFPTSYNQNKNMNNVKNLWELYFEKVSNYSLNEVYNSRNVYFSPSRFKFFLDDYKKKKLKKVFDKYIKPRKKILNQVNNFTKKNFKNKIMLGIHLRGTDQKISARHASPPTIYQIIKLIDLKLSKKKVDKIFLLTEELNYHERLKKLYKNKICSYNFFRANKIREFSELSRKNHRNLLGIENLVEAITLSKCNEIAYCETNISLFSIFYSNFKINKIHINNGFKSKFYFISIFEWYLTKLLPDLTKYYLNKLKIKLK